MKATVKSIDFLNGDEDIKLIITAPKSQMSEISAIHKQYKTAKDKDNDKLFTVDIEPFKKHRSLSANAYFHLLVDKIAKKIELGADELKKQYVFEYGTIDTDQFGEKVGFKLPVSVNVDNIYPYARWFDEREENGKKFNCYIIYKRTRDLNSAEMARLIKGVIYSAELNDIETITPQEQERMLKLLKERG